uniref:Eukaryotic translation initiation factor 5A n=1 Tax=Noctiluca scintillans TaxID=2966 RepID=A7WQ41_NOCSC|nr:translation initiation factor 5A [Noctiluca scintillans]
MSHDDETFESTESGAALVFPQQAGEIRRGSHIMIKGHPCKVAEVSTSKTGKHGHAKAHIVALDLFTNKKYEDLCPTSHNVEVPFVNKTEYQLLSADGDTGEVQLLTESGETKDDISLPTFVKIGEPTDEDKKTTAEILAAVDNGKENTCIVLSACGQEKIIQLRIGN